MSIAANIVSPCVRRGAPWVPTKFAGCVLWLRADLGITLNGSRAAAWADQSGAGNDFAQGTAAKQPLVSGDGPTAELYFAKARGDFLARATITKPTSYTFVIVHEFVSPGAWEILYDSDFGEGFGINTSGAAEVQNSHTGVAVNSICPVGSSLQAVTSHWDGSVLYGRKNAGSWLSSTCGSLGGAGSLVGIGAYGNGVSSTDVKLREVVRYQPALSAGDLATLWSYLSTRYGL